MRYLNGWYESEDGPVPICLGAKTLLDAVNRMCTADEDFGHTDMEFAWGTIDDFEVVTKLIYKLVEVQR